jgi:UDP-N-acetylglucosamine--N-acetylmuramyl-(pentapeptide) pyrophosphoryl-undecaprenol N-acetylglucosamine transferase
MRRAHLVIARGGASTLAELAALGTPSIIVPLAGSLDQDQSHNARELAEVNAAIMTRQKNFSPAKLAAILEPLMADEAKLQAMSAQALAFGEVDAAGRLSRYAHCLAQGVPVQIEAPVEVSNTTGVANG